MDHAAAMSESDRVAQSEDDLNETGKGLGAALLVMHLVHELREALAADELHHDERPVAVLAEVVDRDDVRVLELAGDLSFFGELLLRELFAA